MEYGVLVGWYLQEKAEVLEEKPAPVPLRYRSRTDGPGFLSGHEPWPLHSYEIKLKGTARKNMHNCNKYNKAHCIDDNDDDDNSNNNNNNNNNNSTNNK
jgi:hypothetical protein